MTIHAHAAMAAKKPLEKYEYDPGPLGPDEVEVEITHCGICHSDLHLIDNDWQMSVYPLVPGHEIVGTLADAGANVKHLGKGQRVGIGWQCGSCGHCEYCARGEDNLCSGNRATAVGHYGGFAERVRADARFAFPIPEALESENAAPLLCGGVTVFSPLRRYGVDAAMRVGVVGIGGLGHLALQYAKALGCEVTAFSSTPGKEKEAKGFGAHHFVNTADRGQVRKLAGSLDFILSTIFVEQDWMTYLGLLRPNGRLCFVGAGGTVNIPVFALIGGQKCVCGSVIGGRARIAEMLDFSARHGIRAKTEAAPMAECNQAVDKVRAGQARYRMVLKN